MKNANVNTILFNAAGIGLVVFLGGYMVYSALHKDAVPQCSVRYGDGQQFSLQKGEEAFSPIDLQARLPAREWGLLQNARVVVDKNAAFLQIAVGHQDHSDETNRDPDAEEEDKHGRDGVGFIWQPQNLRGVHSGCLTYRVYMSQDLGFEQRGTLPGLYGVANPEHIDMPSFEKGFLTRIGWDRGGFAGVTLKSPQTLGMWIPAKGYTWPANRWVQVEQEVVLNTPNKTDGIVRLWMDGVLRLEHKGLNLGASEGLSLSGVVSDVGYSETGGKSARVTLSPFVVQGQ